MVRRKANAEKLEKPFEYHIPESAVKTSGITWFLSLILQFLISRWNVSFPEAPMDDEDAFQALLRGIHIVDYNLHTTRYPMKQVRLPAFQGRISIEMCLPAPMMALWTALYSFALYAGIGVKTTLGMSGVSMMKASNLPV